MMIRASAHLISSIILSIPLLLSSCGEFSLDAFNTGQQLANEGNDEAADENQEGEITGPSTTPSDPSTYALFIHGGSSVVWKADAFTLEGMSGFQDCRLDDQLTLTSEGQYTYDGGSNLCGGEDNQQIKSGEYSLDISNNHIIFDPETENEHVATVTGLADDQIVVEGQVLIFGVSLRVAGSYKTE